MGTTSSPELPELLLDDELCGLLRISKATLLRRLRKGPPKARRGEVSIDLRKIRRVRLGGERRWCRESVLRAIRGRG